MVLKVLAYRQVRDDVDPESPQMLGGADPGLEQQLRRVVGAGAEHHRLAGVQLLQRAETIDLHAAGAGALEAQPCRV